jgi:predicted kinase
MLIIFGGLSGVGNTAIARELARQIEAVYLRIDSIEQAMRDSGAFTPPMNDGGYRVAHTIAEDNLRLGRTVVADSVNPLALTRDAWLEVARRAGVSAVEVEIKCSDANEHRRRVESRAGEIPGLRLPNWQEVISREYHAWDREHLVVDTAAYPPERGVQLLREMLRNK